MPFSSGVVRGNFELLTGSSYVYAIAEFIVASIAIITRTETTSFFTRIPPLTHFVLYSSYYAKQGIPDCPASFFHLLKSLYSSITFVSNIFFLIESICNYVYNLQIYFYLFDDFRLSFNIKNCLSFIN